MCKIYEVTSYLESLFPLALQEEYDNCGLLIGNNHDALSGILVCLNVTFDVVEEAIGRQCNLIISHHPIIFKGLKRLAGENETQRLIEMLIKHSISVYSIHTTADKMVPGLNTYIGHKLNLDAIEVLAPTEGDLRKLVTFCPIEHAAKVRQAIFDAGAGQIGQYDSCSFNAEGYGTFRGSETTNPFVGQKGKLHSEPEVRIETIFPQHLQTRVIKALLSAHPYEEVAYDIYKLENVNSMYGLGITGTLAKPLSLNDFLEKMKLFFSMPYLRFSGRLNKDVEKIAFCSGSGVSLIHYARKSHCDVMITSDIKYHEFSHEFDNFILVEVGHYESEQFFKEFVTDILMKKFTNFAIHFSEREKNHIQYY